MDQALLAMIPSLAFDYFGISRLVTGLPDVGFAQAVAAVTPAVTTSPKSNNGMLSNNACSNMVGISLMILLLAVF